MLTSLLGRKIGMTQVSDDRGRVVPVTVIEAGPCQVVQVKTAETDGYEALQLGFDDKKVKNTTRPLQGHFAAAGVTPKRFVREVPGDGQEHSPAEKVTVEIFNDVHFVDVVGTSKGKGFAGVMKRWKFRGQDRTHGAVGRRVPGSIGMSATPSRVLKGRKMAGHMGNARVMVRGLEVIKVDAERNLLLVKGAVPGHNGSYVEVRKSPERRKARKKRH